MIRLPPSPPLFPSTALFRPARLVLTGEVDCSTAPQLRRALDEAFAGQPREVVVDLEAVTFLDSGGLSTLAIAHRTAAGQGARLDRKSTRLNSSHANISYGAF